MGLLMAPFAMPAFAKTSPVAVTMAMADEMPCCPDDADHKAPVNDACKDCLLMAVCALKNIQALPTAELKAAFGYTPYARIVADNDRLSDGLIGSPPTRPPRS